MTTVVKVKDRYLASKLSCYMCKSQGGLTAKVKLHFYVIVLQLLAHGALYLINASCFQSIKRIIRFELNMDLLRELSHVI